MLSVKRADLKGRQDGYKRGWNNGYYQGSCDSIMSKVSEETGLIHDISILYVTAGIGVPYPAIDQAIIEALRALIRELIVAGPKDDVADLAKQFHPDLVLVLNGVVFPLVQVQSIKNQGIKTAVWFTDDPYYTDWTISIAPVYDIVFTLELTCVSFYQGLGCKQVYYLPFAVNPAIFRPKRVKSSYLTDVCFIGTAFWNRVALMDQLSSFLSNKKVIISGWWWNRLQNYSRLRSKIRLGEWMTADETSNYYNGAKIVINLHRKIDDATINANGRKINAVSVNPRTFEIAGCCTLQLTDIREELNNVYHSGRDLATFSSAHELKDKINYYLKHEEERKEMALNGLRRTMRDHTYRKRLIQMINIVFNCMVVPVSQQ